VENPSKQKPAKRKSLRHTAWQLGVVAVVLLLWRLIYQVQQPELIQTPAAPGPHPVIHHGEFFWITQDAGGPILHARPVRGGPERILAQESPDVEVPSSMPLLFTDTDVFYTLHPKPKPQLLNISGAGAGGTGSGSTVINLGTFRPGKERPVPGERHTKLPSWSPESYRLRRVSRGGGPARDVPNVEADYWSWDIQIVGDWIYWIKTRPDDATIIMRGPEVHMERIGHSDLMATSLQTGETRKLAGNMDASAALMSGTGGVYWEEPRPYPDLIQDLYYASATTPRRLAIPGYQASSYDRPFLGSDTLTEYRGRLYWIQYTTDMSHPAPSPVTRPARLVSANSDGSDLKTVLDLTPGKLATFRLLKADQNSLYGAYLPPERYGQVNATLLCRLHPERANPLEILRPMAGGITVDQGYLYFDAEEKVGAFWDLVMNDEVNLKRVSHLYRIPLPK